MPKTREIAVERQPTLATGEISLSVLFVSNRSDRTSRRSGSTLIGLEQVGPAELVTP